jgi:hypothetical protein
MGSTLGQYGCNLQRLTLAGRRGSTTQINSMPLFSAGMMTESSASSTVVYRRKLKMKAKLQSRSEQFILNRIALALSSKVSMFQLALPYRGPDVKVEVLELELARLDAREVEDVVNQAQQRVRRPWAYTRPLFGST